MYAPELGVCGLWGNDAGECVTAAGFVIHLVDHPKLTAQPMIFQLPSLRFSYNALEPWIDAETMRLNHRVHHGEYVKSLNAALAPYPELARFSIEDLMRDLQELPEAIRSIVRDQGGGHANHQFLWKIVGENAGGSPTGALREEINHEFGSFSSFKELFEVTALRLTGSGWAFLVMNLKSKRLEILTLPNNDSVLTHGRSGLLCCDLWEHAYCLRYGHSRAAYLQAFWNVVDWPVVAQRHQKVRDQLRAP
jgi:Fe-Mn family superoxide dismutase